MPALGECVQHGGFKAAPAAAGAPPSVTQEALPEKEHPEMEISLLGVAVLFKKTPKRPTHTHHFCAACDELCQDGEETENSQPAHEPCVILRSAAICFFAPQVS